MNEGPWEKPMCFMCDYGWIIGLIIVLGLILYFTRDAWLPLLGAG